MPIIYSWRFGVRSYDVGVSGQVGLATFLRYFEEGAFQASGSEGFTYEWYRENKRAWVVRKLTIRHFAPAVYGDQFELKSWVSDVKRVQSNREYDLHRVNADGSLSPVARGRANWVYMNAETMLPERVPAEFMDYFDPTGKLDLIEVSFPEAVEVESPLVHISERRVQHYEIDTNGHVNHTVYPQWAEQALVDALRAAGWLPEQLEPAEERPLGLSGVVMQSYAAEIDYVRSAMDTDAIRIKTRLAQVGGDKAMWQVDIHHADNDELLVKTLLVRSFRNDQGPCAIPDALQVALTQRQ